ncbi:MAG: glycosyltransferase family 2 protein [bacterium]
MEDDFKVSVIIPTYNSAEYVVSAVESVLHQTSRPFEVIVVDDGSTDNTKEILTRFDDRIRYIFRENGGPALARNTGLRNASGNCIAFIDSDDIWQPDKLEKQLAYLKAQPEVALVYTDLYLLSVNGLKDSVHFQPFYGSEFFSLLKKNFIATSTVLVKRKCFEEIGLFDERPEVEANEDYEMWLRIARHFKIGCIKEKLVQHRLRNSGHSRDLDRQVKSGVFVKRRVFDTLPDTKQMRTLKAQCWGEFYKNAAYAYFYKYEFAKAREHFRLALKYGGFGPKHIIYYLVTLLPSHLVEVLNRERWKLLKHQTI